MKSKVHWLTSTLLITSCAQVNPIPEAPHKVLGTLTLTLGEDPSITPQASNFTVLNKSVQLKNLGTKTVDSGGYRYFSTTYSVRNAQSNGVVYTTPKTNITFLAYLANGNLQSTAVRKLIKADGSAADPTLALQVKPSPGITDIPSNPSMASGQQSLQAFSQQEVNTLLSDATVQGYGITNLFPYGFVVTKSDGSRTLPANPTISQYDGKVTIAVKVPLQNPVTDTPKSVTLTMLVVEDQTTQVTESLEEQQLGSTVASRQVASGATQVNVFQGSSYTGSDRRILCKVPLSTGSAPSYLVNDKNTITSITPYLTSLASTTSSVQANLGGCDDFFAPLAVSSNAQNQLVIQGFQTGKRLSNYNSFNQGTFSQVGSQWIYTPSNSAGFKPGEEVQVTVVNSTDVIGHTHRFRIASSPEGATGYLTPVNYNTGTRPYGVTLGDLNGDGQLDLISANNSANTVSVLLGNGDGTLQTRTDHTVDQNPNKLKVGDLNNDGKLDVITNNLFSVSVLLGNGDGTFQTSIDQPLSFFGGTELALGDLNQDGQLDVVAVGGLFGDGALEVFHGNGDGTLQSSQSFNTSNGNNNGIALSDLNQDGALDLLTAGRYGVVEVFLNDGAGSFQSGTTYSTGMGSQDIQAGDLNGDGNPDVVVTNYNDQSISVLLGNGDGTLQSKVDYSVGVDPFGGELGDVNGDGTLDLLSIGNGGLSVLIGNGDGTFQTRADYSAGSNPMDVALGDLNGDGKLDVVTADQISDAVPVLIKQ